MLFGGLEFVVGGVVLHQYNKKKNEKKRCDEEWNQRQRRQNSYPGVQPQNTQYQHQTQPQQQYQQQQHLAIPQQKYACYAPQPQYFSPSSPVQPRPHTAQTFPLAHPPQPQMQMPMQSQSQIQFQHQPVPWIQQPVIQPVQRVDTFGTISNMPVANGIGHPSRDNFPYLPPRPQPPNMYLQPISPHSPISPISPIGSPYGNVGFSRSTPNFTHSPTELRYDNNSSFGRNTVDDVDAYEPEPPRAQNIRPEEDENDPPPPYRP